MRYFLPIFCSVFILVGLMVAIRGLFDFLRARQSASWPKTSGIITRSVIEDHSDSEGTSYAPDIAFRYTVEGAR